LKSRELIETAHRAARTKAKDPAEVLVWTVYFLAVSIKAARAALMEYALYIYRRDLWKAHKLFGKDWRKWVKSAVGKTLTAQEQSLLINGIPILNYLRTSPISKGRVTVTDATFFGGKLSSFCDALPVLSRLDINAAADRTIFDNVLLAAATMPRKDFRKYLEKYGRRSRRFKVAGKVFYRKDRATVLLTCSKADIDKLVARLHSIANVSFD
jgi:hypothetical protein